MEIYVSMSSQTCSNSYIQSTAVSAPVSTSVFVQCTIKDAHKASLGSSGFEHQTEENLKWGNLLYMGSTYFLQNQKKNKDCNSHNLWPNLYYNDIRWHKHTGFEQKNSVPRHTASCDFSLK